MDMEGKVPGQYQGAMKAENVYTFCDEQKVWNFVSEGTKIVNGMNHLSLLFVTHYMVFKKLRIPNLKAVCLQK
jgi:hypothetical protein